MENVRKRRNIELVVSEKRLRKLFNKIEFVDRTIFEEEPLLAAVHLQRTKIYFNRPIYVGMSILDISKIVMYKFHYDVTLKMYRPANVNLLYMDTDSFIYEIKTEDVYADMALNLQHFDTSDYPTDHPCFSVENKKVLGKFKDEMCGVPVTGFVGLRPKVYSIINKNSNVIKKSKGVKKSVVKNELTFLDYKNCLFNNVNSYKSMYNIRSFKHKLYTILESKVSLSSYDDKRIILGDNINTLAIGHADFKNHRYKLGSVHNQLLALDLSSFLRKAR